jgi:hypothetical protein
MKADGHAVYGTTARVDKSLFLGRLVVARMRKIKKGHRSSKGINETLEDFSA